ncbi:MAG: ABC transporter ATP-binding protein [Phycisphaerales bacterium]
MLTANALTSGYRRDEPVLRDVSLEIGPGRVLVILGPNGAGKTTLIRLLAGLAPPWSGSVTLDGVAIGQMTARRRSGSIAYVGQRPSVASAFTVREVVELGRHAVGADGGAVDRALDAVGMLAQGAQVFWRLSAGQQQRVSIARALAQLDHARDAGDSPGVILADEPIASLDPRHAQRALDAIRAVAARGGGVGVVMHDLTTALRFADDALILGEEGVVLASGPVSEALRPETLQRVFGTPFERVEGAGGPALLPVPVAPAASPGRYDAEASS